MDMEHEQFVFGKLTVSLSCLVGQRLYGHTAWTDATFGKSMRLKGAAS